MVPRLRGVGLEERLRLPKARYRVVGHRERHLRPIGPGETPRSELSSVRVFPSVPANVSELLTVSVLPSVPANVRELFAVSTLPLTIVRRAGGWRNCQSVEARGVNSPRERASRQEAKYATAPTYIPHRGLLTDPVLHNIEQFRAGEWR